MAGKISVDLPNSDGANGTSQLRDRSKSSKKNLDKSTTASKNPNSDPQKATIEIEKEAKTYGRTSDGNVFVVPQTHDMVSTLLSPKEPKNLSDLLVLGVLAFHISLLFILPQWSLKPVFMFLFIFWRAGYNLGIGLLLRSQSKYKQLVHWAAKYKIFDKKAHPKLYAFIKREISTKIPPEDYDFDEAPIEYNTWMVFRRLVDLILMCDFVNYVLFAYVATEVPTSHKMWLHVCRWTAGVILFVFNVWVKLDAHRVVKDYAWYWGDFFFMIEQSLTFDGVYEIAPHPMYSVGYAGYYGISLFSASYTVFAISLLAHAAQFAFLVLIEDPHIQKIYNPPPPRRKGPQKPTLVIDDGASSNMDVDISPPTTSSADIPELIEELPAIRPLLGYQNFDFLRTPDLQLVLLGVYTISLALLVPATPFTQTIFILHALFWRLFYSVGLGVILNLQSERKSWTRHFLKYGETLDESWRQWRSLFHMTTCMCHLSFAAACWKVYSLPENWFDDMALLKHMLGFLLVALQIWAATSIYDSVGEFGWFYGDFFFDTRPKLTYSGIYRFLNNPERLFGCASVWGLALVTSNPAIYLIALIAHIATHLSIDFVERPHMQKLYGDLRKDAGVARTLKRAVPKDLNARLQKIQGSLDKVANTTSDLVEEFLDRALKRLSNNEEANGAFLQEGTSQRRHLSFPTSTRILFSSLSDASEISKLDLSLYSISILSARQSPKPPGSALDDTFGPLSVSYGSAVKVAWTAPKLHSKKDWIGLYRVNDNSKRSVTGIASMGRWTAVSRGEYPPYDEEAILVSDEVKPIDEDHDEEYIRGEAVFEGHRLFWHTGVYEFRYHHGGRHQVLAISLPFEIVVDKFDENSNALMSSKGLISVEEIQKPLMGVVRDCFDRKEELAPETVDDEFGSVAEMQYAKRIVYAVKEMFGLDLAPEVVKADGTVRKLAWRIVNAKRVLAPFSLSRSSPSAPSSPTEA